MSTRPRRRGAPITGCTATCSNCTGWWSPNCRSIRRASASSAIRWAGTAPWCWRCAIPDLFRSVSAFAPICAPSRCPWGRKAFSGYLGSDQARWQQYDASALMASRHTPFPGGILIDQGLADKFLADQLYPEAFEQACGEAQQPLAAAPASRLRPRLLFHLHLHRRPPSVSRSAGSQ